MGRTPLTDSGGFDFDLFKSRAKWLQILKPRNTRNKRKSRIVPSFPRIPRIPRIPRFPSFWFLAGQARKFGFRISAFFRPSDFGLRVSATSALLVSGLLLAWAC